MHRRLGLFSLLRHSLLLALAGFAGWTPALAQRTFVISPPIAGVGDAKISADGTLIVIREADYFRHLYSMRPDGSGFRPLGVRNWGVFNLSGTGRLLVRDWPGGEFSVLDLETMEDRWIPSPGPWFYLPTISDDGSLVCDTDAYQLWCVEPDGSNMRNLGGTSAGYPGGPSITSDGSVIAFDDAGDLGGYGFAIYRMDPDGSNVTHLAEDPNRIFIRARISGDGSVITFDDYGTGLWAVDPDGANLRPLITGVSGSYFGEEAQLNDVNFDGSMAVYGSAYWVLVVGTDGTGLRQLPGPWAGTVSMSGRGDIVTTGGVQDGKYVLAVHGVPGVSPGPMIDLAFGADAETLTWATRPSANAHNLYRDSTSSPGALDPMALGDCLEGGILGTSTLDPASPAPGEAFLYYVTGENGWGEGPGGPPWQGIEHSPASSCPDIDTDGDAVVDALDGCPLLADPAQEDPDGDGINTPCDNCPGWPNSGQVRVWADAEVGDLIGYVPDTVVVFPNGGEQLDIGTVATLQWSTTKVCDLNAPVDILLSRDGPGGPFETLATGLPNTGSWDWTVTGPAVNSPSAVLRVVVTDVGPSVGSDDSDGAFRIR